MALSDAFLREQLCLLGYVDARQIAIGMQGAVFQLGEEKIAKIWFHADEAELRRLQVLYAALDGELPFHTPQVLEIHRPGPFWVTIEAELPGVPLHAVAPQFGSPGWERTQDCVVEVLHAISAVEPPAVLHQLAVLDERQPFRPEGLSWIEALSGLIHRRASRDHDQLRLFIPDFDSKVERLLALLAEMKEPRTRLVHGDVTAGNILVDDDLRPLTVLDLGLMTVPGDPIFDAAAAASLNELWSPRVREVEAAFDAAFVSRLGYDAGQLLLYRCAYSLVISNAHDKDPYDRDSHLPLTARLFNTPRVAQLLN